MKKININILKDKILRLKLVKNEYILKILKSILQNNNIHLLRKNYILFLYNKCKNKKTKTTKRVNTCILTGSRHSIVHKMNFCRQQSKRLLILNKIDNIQIYI